MAKYSFEFKKKIVEAYFNGEGSMVYLSKKYNINGDSQIHRWISNYKAFGDNGLIRSRKNKTYSFEYKLHIVQLYLSNKVSCQELAIAENINNSTLISKWVNDFKIAGPEALRQKKRGRKSLNSSKKKLIHNETNQVDANAERIKQLEDELLKLRIENAYLKELRRLRLEEEKLQKKWRE